MKISVRASGLIKSGPERTLLDDYLGRANVLGRNLGIGEVFENAVDTRNAKSKAEATKAVLSTHKPGDILVVLDEGGKEITSRQIAKHIAGWRDMGTHTLTIAIGPADGFDKTALPANTISWSLGKQTWPHKLVRIMMCEQIYRALSILAKTPYHRQ